ncbi:MAG: alpha/beta hydrolase [Saccharofermentans sp.]|nr:alpha/beta hydrolase [Saccharofermentans sp.]
MVSDIQKVTANGARIEYFKYGEGKRTLVVLPGLAVKSILLYKDMVADALGLFGEGFEVYVFDRRLNLPDSYSIEDMAKDYIAAFESLGLKDVAIYGISQGGMIALTLTLLRPDLVSALVLGSTSARLTDESKQVIGAWNSYSSAKDESGLIDSFIKYVYSPAFVEQFGPMIADSLKGITDVEFERLAILTGKMNEYDVFSRLGEIKCPSLILCGDGDAVLGNTATTELSAISGSELYVFKGFGHAVYDENLEFKERAKEFLTKTLL